MPQSVAQPNALQHFGGLSAVVIDEVHALAGIKRGDEIVLIDGLDVRAMNTHQIHAALSGDVDATVKLTLTRGDQQVIRATLKRTEAQKLVKRLPMTDE